MAGWDGNGNLILPYLWTNDAANGIPITASRMDTQEATLATAGFGNTVTRDNQGKPAANFLPDTDNAYSMGSGAFRWTIVYSLTGVFSTSIGVGMVAVNPVDVTSTANSSQIMNILNASTGTAAAAGVQTQSSASKFGMFMLGVNYTPANVLRSDGGIIQCDGGGGLTLNTHGAARPIYFAVNDAEVSRFGTDGSLLVGTTTNTGAGTLGTHVYTVATLPTGAKGARSFVSDANSTTFAAAAVGGGSNNVPVYHDGSGWKIG